MMDDDQIVDEVARIVYPDFFNVGGICDTPQCHECEETRRESRYKVRMTIEAYRKVISRPL